MTEGKTSRLYFAYGLNINLEQMRQKCAKAKVLGIARLVGYNLAFYEYNTVWDGAMETIFPAPDSEVWGVLYKLDAYEWEELDCFEDARMDGTGAYFHYPVEVFSDAQLAIEATVYLKARWGQSNLPSTEYMAAIIHGAKEHGIPEGYILQLENMPTKPASYTVPKRPSGSRLALNGDCSGCS